MGLIVPKLKQTAVARNRLKRRLRELARLHLLPARLPVDVVVRVRAEAYAAGYDELHADVQAALAQLTRWARVLTALSSPPVSAELPRQPDDSA